MTDLVLDRARFRSLYDLRTDVYASRGGSFDVDPYPTFSRLRETGPVHEGAPHEALGWTGEVFFTGLPYTNRRHFTVYDFATASTVLRDDEQFVAGPAAVPGDPTMPDSSILMMDGSKHRKYRRLVQPSFVPGNAVWWLDNWVRNTVSQLIDAFRGDIRADLSSEFCAPIPLLTITGSFGITIEVALDIRTAVTSDERQLAMLAAWLTPITAARRLEPRDDLISVLVAAEMIDESGSVHRLTDEEVLSFAFLLLSAGSGTTWKQMGITLNALLRHPRALEAARQDPSFVRVVVEESLRWQPTDPVFARFARTDCELAGTKIPKGAVVHICLAAANRDPARWERPDEFDPFRPLKTHVGFGTGPHTCLGAHVARLEMTHGITALLERLPGLRIDQDAPEPKMTGLYERGPDAVPVCFDDVT